MGDLIERFGGAALNPELSWTLPFTSPQKVSEREKKESSKILLLKDQFLTDQFFTFRKLV